jgi:hypothetical protein
MKRKNPRGSRSLVGLGKCCLAVMAALGATSGAMASTYAYVGSFNVFDGAFVGDVPDVLSARQAAAYLFGGVYSDYAISVSSSLDPLTISHSAWLDGYFDPQYLETPADEDFVGTLSSGKYDDYGAYSALVCDHAYCQGWGDAANAGLEYPSYGYSYTNYVWRISGTSSQVPEPSSLAVVLAGLGVLGGAQARRRS